jgi:hypothetical protein
MSTGVPKGYVGKLVPNDNTNNGNIVSTGGSTGQSQQQAANQAVQTTLANGGTQTQATADAVLNNPPSSAPGGTTSPLPSPNTTPPEAASSDSGGSPTGSNGSYQFVSQAAATAITEAILNGSGTPNILNLYQNVTYHFRFFTLNDINLYETVKTPPTSAEFFNAIIPDPNQPIGVASSNNGKISTVIVAESGATIYNIKNVEFISMIGPNIDTRNVNIGTFTMTIVEPLGGSFLTALKAASDAVANSNFKNCFYYLELTFKAYDTSGNQVTNIFPSSFPNSTTAFPLTLQQGDRWIWEVQITDIDISIDAGGGTYVLTLILSDSMALDDEIHAVPETISATGNTLGEYFTYLGAALTASWATRYGNQDVSYGDTKNDIPAFKFFPIQLNGTSSYDNIANGADPATFQIIDPSYPNVQPQQTKDTELENGYIRGYIQPGVTIEKIIESAIGATKQGQTLGIGGKNPYTGESNSGSTQPSESIIFRTIPTVIITGYNIISGRYIITVTFNIIPYYTQYPILSPIQTQNQTSQQALTNLIKRGLLQKKYEYIYTGLNTEILNLNIQLNAKWNAVLPTNYGLLSNAASVAPGKSIGANSPKNATNQQTAATAKLSQSAILYSQATQIQTVLLPQLNSLMQEATSALGQNSLSNSSDATTSNNSNNAQTVNNLLPQITNYNQTAASYNLKNPTNQVQLLATPKLNSSLESVSANISSVANSTGNVGVATTNAFNKSNNTSIPEVSVPANSVSFAENLVISQGGTYGTFMFPVTFSQSYRDVTEQTGINFVNDLDNDRTLLGAVLNQMYDYSANPLMSIDLTIKLDPYFLGETNLSKCVYLRGKGTPPPAESYQPSQLFGEMNFVLAFNIPYQVSSNQSNIYQPQLEKDEAYTGVYIITQIKNTFEDGQMTQTLTGKRQPLISLLNAQGLSTSSTLPDGSQGDTGASSSPQQQSTPLPPPEAPPPPPTVAPPVDNTSATINPDIGDDPAG